MRDHIRIVKPTTVDLNLPHGATQNVRQFQVRPRRRRGLRTGAVWFWFGSIYVAAWKTGGAAAAR